MSGKGSTVTVTFLGDASKFKKTVGEVEGASDKVDGKFKQFGKGLGLAAGAAAATAGVEFFKGGVESLARIDKLNAQTAATLKSMGGQAGVTAKDIEKLSSSIEKATSVEAEAVQEGANLLLTFGNIKNAAGVGNDVFNQSTKVLTDMSVALGTDVSSSAMQLGKALNDPVAGISALNRVGVTFTQQQKDQVKAMVEAGDTMGAQKVILGELNKQFGGSAEALGETLQGRLDKVRNQFGEMQESVTLALLPALTMLGEKVGAVVGWFANLSPGMQQAIGIGIALAGGVFLVVKAVQAWTAVQAALNFVLSANPIGLLVVGIAALVAGVVWAYKNVGWFRDGVQSAFGAMAGAAQWLGGVFSAVWSGVVAGFGAVRSGIKSGINFVIRLINSLIGGLNKVGSTLNKIPGVQVNTIGTIPELANGGVVTRPTLALVGEAGPEAVVPLDRYNGAGGGGGGITVNFNGVTTREAADQVVRILNDHFGRGGGLADGRGGSLRPA